MPRNPLYNNGRIDAQNNGLTHDNKASNPVKKYSQGMNTFNNSYMFATTERFADISPFLYMDCISRDTIPFRSAHKLSSYTLQSPMMDEIYKHKFYSIVPYRAILPNTWEVFFANPTKGDDVPDDVYCNANVLRCYCEYLRDLLVKLSNTDTSTIDIMTYAPKIFEFYIVTESIFSSGSLLSSLKYNFWSLLSGVDNSSDYVLTTFDNLFDVLMSLYVRYFSITYEVQPDKFEILIPHSMSPEISTNIIYDRIVSDHTFLDILRSGDYYSVDVASSDIAVDPEFVEIFTNIQGQIMGLFIEIISKYGLEPSDLATVDLSSVGYDVDLSAVIAYQITCLSQATDPSIDYIFNANLFRETLFPLDTIERFTYNGRYFVYETFSKHYLESYWFNPANFVDTCQKLFSYAKSLKFGDYFTQMRPQRTAVGDLSIDTSDGLDALEITRKMVYQRFLNWNNRVGPKYEDYIKELTGMSAMPDPTEPSLITHSQSVVGSYQVENTGEAQLSLDNSVTTLLRDTNSDFEFDIIISEPSILLGLTSYDMMRLYTRVMDRSHLKDSRFDFFNHMLQYTGDQDIKALELDASSDDSPIGYNTKDIHYKMQVSVANGGFITSLKSWAFTSEFTDNDMTMKFGINPQFIRNTNGDFDRFYSSLTGYSLGTYFHFILKYTNDLSNMRRPMDVAPDIL